MNGSEQGKSKRIVKNTVMLFLRMLLVLAVGLYTSRVILDKLGVEDFGLYNVVGSVVVLFTFLQQALNNATYRYLTVSIGEGDMNNLKNVFSMSLNAHLILAGIIVLLCETVGLWMLEHKLVVPESRHFAAMIAYQLSVLCCCLSIIRTPYNSVIVAHEQMDFFAYTSIVEVILKLVIVYILVIGNCDKLILYSILVFAISVVMLAWYYFRCRRSFEECRYKRFWDKKLINSMVKYSGWSIVVNLTDICVNQSAIFFFNIFFGLVANAALGIANQVNGQLNNFLSSFSTSYNPQIMKSYASGDRDYFMKLIFSSSKFSYYLLFLISLPVVLNVDFILNIWLTNPPEGAGLFFILVICHSLIDAYSAPLWTGVHATGHLRTHQILMASIKLMNIPIAYIMLKAGCPAWSILALKALLNIVCSIVRPCYVKQLFGLPLGRYFRDVWAVVYLITTLIVPIPYIMASHMPDGWLKLFATSSVFVVISLPVIYFIGLTKSERMFLKTSIIPKIKRNND